MGAKLTTEDFIQKSKRVHGDKYDYSLSDYLNAQTKIKIICPVHGVFEQKPNSHYSGFDCRECGYDKQSATKLCATEAEMFEQMKNIHNNKYDYSLANFSGVEKKIKIICPVHGVFEQMFKYHMSGHNCLQCSKEISAIEKYKNKPTYLYYIKINSTWKIGLTKDSVPERFHKKIIAGDNIRIISQKLFTDGYKAWELEQTIIDKYADKAWKPKESEKFGGWTECFTEDVLKEFH